MTNREGLTTLSKIEHIMQEVIQASMEIHQLKRVPSSTHSSDTRINSGMLSPLFVSLSKTYIYCVVHIGKDSTGRIGDFCTKI